MRWFSRRRKAAPSVSGSSEPEEAFVVGGDRIVFWKAKEQVDGENYGPAWIADANDPDTPLEEPDLWLSWGQAEEFARKRGLPLEDV